MVVNYDNDAYPGIIVEVEEQKILVKCINCNGINKFYWTSSREDINWYADQQMICLITKPQAVNKHSVQVYTPSWKYVRELLKSVESFTLIILQSLCFSCYLGLGLNAFGS